MPPKPKRPKKGTPTQQSHLPPHMSPTQQLYIPSPTAPTQQPYIPSPMAPTQQPHASTQKKSVGREATKVWTVQVIGNNFNMFLHKV